MSPMQDDRPIAELWQNRNYRNFWLAQISISAVGGTLRFVFVWLVVTLTDWTAAEGLVTVALGIPAMLLSLPAGAWSDRSDRRQFFLTFTGINTILLACAALLVGFDLVNVGLAAGLAFILGASSAMMSPNLHAMVPLLVEPRLLMNAIALQNGGSQAASFAGLALAGVAIALLGNGGGFGLLTAFAAFAYLLMRRVEMPPADPLPDRGSLSLGTVIIEGAKFGLSRDPLRTLLICAVLLGGSFPVVQVSLPRVVDEEFGKGSGAAGLVLGIFGIGMLLSSVLIARRTGMKHGRNVAIFLGIGLGGGQLAVSFARTYAAAFIVMFCWGFGAGIAMASHRTLIQLYTPKEMMGRVMGLMMLGLAGALPIGALVQSLLAPAVGPTLTMRYVGLFTMVCAASLTWRPAIRNL